MPYLKRSIYFFRLDAGIGQNGFPLEPDLISPLTSINELPFNNEGRYFQERDRKLCLWLDKSTYPLHLRLGNIRMDNFPQVEEGGELTALDLASRAGLAESIHIVIFEHNILGFDYNSFGPRISSFSDYLNIKARAFFEYPLAIEPLINQELIRQLNRFQFLTSFVLKIHTPIPIIIDSANHDIFEALDNCANISNAETVEFELKASRKTNSRLGNSIFDTVKRLVSTTPDQDQAIQKLEVIGYDSERMQFSTLDLLSSKIISKRQIMKINDHSRVLDPISAFSNIEIAYNELRDEILSAFSLEL